MGIPEQDVESLGVMGWWLEAGRKFFRLRPWAWVVEGQRSELRYILAL